MELDWKAIVRTVAPAVASVFGTPLAGLGVSALVNALLPPDAAQPTDPEEFLKTALATINPEGLLKLKQADQAFLLEMKKLDIDLQKFASEQAVANTASARTLKQNWLSSTKWDYEPVLAIGVMAAFGYAEFWVFDHIVSGAKLDPNMSMLLGRVLGMVDAAFMMLLSFRWGTSVNFKKQAEADAKKDIDNM